MTALPEDIWTFAEELRQAALPIVDKYFRAPDLAIEEKEDVSPVTLRVRAASSPLSGMNFADLWLDPSCNPIEFLGKTVCIDRR